MLIEVAVAVPVVLIALGMFVQMLSAGAELRRGGSEDWRASSAAQQVLEEMRNEDFRDLFALYNADPFDDPHGAGTAPGASFAVPGLTVLEDDPDGRVGEVLLPFVNTGSEVVPVWEVREDADVPELGMPRDLNGDVLIDERDHADDCALLPVVVRLRWKGRHGERELAIHTVLSEYR